MTANTNPYLALGVRPFINCCSVRTMHGGSLMLPQVRAAIDAASRQFVNLDELMDAAGRRIAELTGAEWGIVTCGSAAAVALGTAACVAGNDPAKMLRLPFTEGMVNRVIIPWLQRGADLVIYSGGKFLRGPQTSGLLLGNKRLVQAAWRNGSPHQALGRPMKVSKEDVIGVIAALEHWFEERDPAIERRKWDEDCAIIAERLARLDGVRGEVLEPEGVDRVPRLKIVWDRARFPLDGLALRQRALEGEPRVMLDDNSATENSIAVDPFQLEPGEAVEVADAVTAGLRAAMRAKPASAPPPPIAIAGDWELRPGFPHGS